MQTFNFDLRDELKELIPDDFQILLESYYDKKINELKYDIDNGIIDDDNLSDAWHKLFNLNKAVAYFINDEQANYIINTILPVCAEKEDLYKKEKQQKTIKEDLYKVPEHEPEDNPDKVKLGTPLYTTSTTLDPFEGSTPYFNMFSDGNKLCCDFANNIDDDEIAELLYGGCNEQCDCCKCQCDKNCHCDKKSEEKYEMVNSPKHYNSYSVEVIDMFEKIYGAELTSFWCELTALKYRMRMGTKPNNPIEQDLEKEQWYLQKAKELRSKLNK